MAPNPHESPGGLSEIHKYERITGDLETKNTDKVKEPMRLKKFSIVVVAAFHLLAVYGVLTKLPVIMWSTMLWTWCMMIVTGIGVTAGVHRYYSHRSYKATTPLKVLLTVAYSTAGQLKINSWVRDHRVHHKYSETDADPHDVRRGIFFAHFGWFLVEKSSKVMEKGRLLDLSDITNCPIVRFHDRNFELLRLLMCFILPTVVPIYCWGEDPWVAFLANCFRFIYTLNGAWAVNSFAHNKGHRPYDRTLRPVDNDYVSFFTLGEGWHNFHHVFPYDYRSNELDNTFNPTKIFIQCMEKIGWAYDLRTATDAMVERRVKRMGDGTHQNWGTVGGVKIEADENELGY